MAVGFFVKMFSIAMKIHKYFLEDVDINDLKPSWVFFLRMQPFVKLIIAVLLHLKVKYYIHLPYGPLLRNFV